MTKEQFIDFLKGLNLQMPDKSIQIEYIQNNSTQYGISKESFYSAIFYFYEELKKLHLKEKSIFIGETIIVDEFIGLVSFGTCVLKLECKLFEELPLIFKKAHKVEDYPYGVKWFKDKQYETIGDFHYWKDEINKRGFYIISDTSKNIKMELYTPELMQILRSDKIEAHNTRLNIDEVINGHDYYRTFVDAYIEGVKAFKNEFEVPASVLFGDNAKEIISNLDTQYNENWRFVQTSYPRIISHTEIKRFGYYSGMVATLKIFYTKYPTIFSKFELPASSNEVQTTAKYPVIDTDKYNSDLIYEKFVKNGLLFKCTKEVFNSWFVDGIKMKQITSNIKFKPQLFHLLKRISTQPDEQINNSYFKQIFTDKMIEGISYKVDENDKIKGTFKYKTELLECEKKMKI